MVKSDNPESLPELEPTLSGNEPEPVEAETVPAFGEHQPVPVDTAPAAPTADVTATQPAAPVAVDAGLSAENESLRARLARYESAPVVSDRPDVTYTVQPGDTWDSLAELHSVNAETLIAHNRAALQAAAEARGFSGFAVPPLFAGEVIRLPE